MCASIWAPRDVSSCTLGLRRRMDRILFLMWRASAYIAETLIVLQRQWLVQHVQKSFFTSTNDMFCLFAILKLVSSVAGNLRPMLLANFYCTYST